MRWRLWQDFSAACGMWLVIAEVSCGRGQWNQAPVDGVPHVALGSLDPLCDRPLSTHTIRNGSIIYRYYRCRSTAGGREPCKGVLVSAPEIESAVLQAAGVGQTGLTSKEEEGPFKARFGGS